jgi:hypothetical protein
VVLPESDSARGIWDVRIAGKEIMSNLFADRERSKERHMDDSVTDRLASQLLELLIDFEMGFRKGSRSILRRNSLGLRALLDGTST